MDSVQDNLQNAEGSKGEKLKKTADTSTETEDRLTEESMVQESKTTDTEIVVSSDEEIDDSEPQFEEKPGMEPTADTQPAEDSTLDADAMVNESEKEKHTLVLTDEDLEKEDDVEEVHSDEDEHDEHEHHELQMPDYAEYAPDALIKEAEKLVKNEPVQNIKAHFEAIRKNILKQLNEERQHKLEEFLETGGVEMDFQYVQPLREKFRNIYAEYKSRRQKHYQELQDVLDNNLKIKLDLIEKIKDLVNKDESIGDTFKEFNAIQQEWRNTGPVPRQESADLWRTYHHHVENFYEYIKINKELRDLDFKKNREAKEELIAKAEKLPEKENIREAFKELQALHKKWKNIGPVEREHRESMWERFSAATKNLHDKREEYYAEMRERAGELIEEKKKLISKLKEIDYTDIDSHHRWQKSIKHVEGIRSDFRKLGRISHPENDVIWDEFRVLLREFNHAKNQYYKNLKKEHHENLAKKRELVEIAEKLKDSDDWREATNEMKRIQALWKTIGHVPKSESDKIWKKFRSACNHYFDRLTDHNKDRDKALEGNYTAKQQMLEELKAYEPAKEEQKKSVTRLKETISAWKELGPVPRSQSQIETEFNKVLDQKFKAIDLDRKESQRIRFENKMDTMTDGNSDRQLTYERQTIRKQIDEARKELNQLETNMSFFSSSNPNNPLLKEAEKNIRKQREQIDLLHEKLKMLNVKIREINKPEEVNEAGENPAEADDRE